jgi:hypothetical protein
MCGKPGKGRHGTSHHAVMELDNEDPTAYKDNELVVV